MRISTVTLSPDTPENPVRGGIQTTLYDLIEAIADEVGSGEEDLITETVLHMYRNGRIKFVGNGNDIQLCFL